MRKQHPFKYCVVAERIVQSNVSISKVKSFIQDEYKIKPTLKQIVAVYAALDECRKRKKQIKLKKEKTKICNCANCNCLLYSHPDGTRDVRHHILGRPFCDACIVLRRPIKPRPYVHVEDTSSVWENNVRAYEDALQD